MTLSALRCLLVGGDTGFVSLALTPELSSDARLALLVRFRSMCRTVCCAPARLGLGPGWISGGFLARAHWIVSSAACLTLLRAGWFVLRVAMSERVVGRYVICVAVRFYVVSWRCAVAGFHPACVPHASRHVLLVVCCGLDRRLSRGRFLHVGGVRRMYAAAAAACRAPHRLVGER